MIIQSSAWRINFNKYAADTTEAFLQDLSCEWSTQSTLLVANTFHSCLKSDNCFRQSLHVYQIANSSYYLSQWPHFLHINYFYHWLYLGIHYLLFCRDARCSGSDIFSMYITNFSYFIDTFKFLFYRQENSEKMLPTSVVQNFQSLWRQITVSFKCLLLQFLFEIYVLCSNLILYY